MHDPLAGVYREREGWEVGGGANTLGIGYWRNRNFTKVSMNLNNFSWLLAHNESSL